MIAAETEVRQANTLVHTSYATAAGLIMAYDKLLERSKVL